MLSSLLPRPVEPPDAELDSWSSCFASTTAWRTFARHASKTPKTILLLQDVAVAFFVLQWLGEV